MARRPPLLLPLLQLQLLLALLALLQPAVSNNGDPEPDFTERAAASPALQPHLLPRPHGGYHEWTFAVYGVPTPGQGSAFEKTSSAMQKFGVGNGFDPFPTSATSFTEGSKLGWPISFSPIQGGNRCFTVPGCVNNMTVEQYSLLKILDEANVYYEIQFGEWGNYFAGLQPAKGNTSFAKGNVNWWHNVFPNTTCNATLCQSAPNNPSNTCCAACHASMSCGNLTNTTDFDILYPKYATPDTDPSGRKLFGYETMPPDKKTAYEIYRDYYNGRIAWISSVGDRPYSSLARINSMTCASHMELYAALWNSQGPNAAVTASAALELQCGHANAAFAMARGGSRRFGKIWTAQPSGYGFGPATEGCGPLQCTGKGARMNGQCPMAGGATCSGAEASHSYSYYWRVWLHTWFAGAAKLTDEGPAMGLFCGLIPGPCATCNASRDYLIDPATGVGLTRHGLQAQTVLATARSKDRGVPLMPLGVIADLHLGYYAGSSNSTVAGENHWNVLPMSAHDLAFDHLLHKQLYIPSGLMDEELRSTPHGEIADIMLSDAPPEYLALYPVLLLVGEQDFNATGDGGGATLAARLLAALKTESCTELLLQQYHVQSMVPADWAALNGTGKVRVVAPGPANGSKQVPAISDSDLSAIGAKHLPVVVASVRCPCPQKDTKQMPAILWQVNAQKDGGFVIELSNEYGVKKLPCGPMSLDPKGVATVTLQVNKAASGASEWITGAVLHAGPIAAGSVLTVTVPPGNTSFVAFGANSVGHGTRLVSHD